MALQNLGVTDPLDLTKILDLIEEGRREILDIKEDESSRDAFRRISEVTIMFVHDLISQAVKCGIIPIKSKACELRIACAHYLLAFSK